MFNLGLKSEHIFHDRRSDLHPGDERPDGCRRNRDRNMNDARPWWLKVNYVSNHLQLIHCSDRKEM